MYHERFVNEHMYSVMPYHAWEPEYGDVEKHDYTFFETPEKAMKYLHDNIYDAYNEYPLRYETWKEWAEKTRHLLI